MSAAEKLFLASIVCTTISAILCAETRSRAKGLFIDKMAGAINDDVYNRERQKIDATFNNAQIFGWFGVFFAVGIIFN